jgi:2-polyprenyl-6-methoxyphenol hydroxylase-like FAD-dependent oxidoreductase
MSETEVLIAGAGPTGLVLALSLAKRGIACRIVDRAAGPGEASRAMVVQARTLELYEALGIAEGVVGRGIRLPAVQLREDGEVVARVALADLGQGLSPYPFALAFPQDEHERFLVEQLDAAGIAIEWGTELLAFTETPEGIEARLRHGAGETVCRAAFLCGCDGAHSRVRQALGLDFPGGTYRQRFYVADVRIAGPFQTDLQINLDPSGLALMFPVRSGQQRLLGILPEALDGRDDLGFEDVRAPAEGLLGIWVEAVNWFSTYHVHHRIAGRFRTGRAFIAGDAGHIHSPAGGQGMNTGIGDAVNLAWKLAAVLRGQAAPALLDTYEPERIAFARSLVETTDRAFQAVVSRGRGGRLLRHWVVPHLLPFLAGFSAARHAFFRILSQIRIAYPQSALSEGEAGDVAGGDRMPWVPGEGSMASLGWRLAVHGALSPGLAAAAVRLGLDAAARPWSDAAGQAGLRRDAAYLLRPDGHVGLAWADQDPRRLEAYAAHHGLAFYRPPAPRAPSPPGAGG